MESYKTNHYHSYEINRLVKELQIKAKQSQISKKKLVQQQRKHHSCIQINKKRLEHKERVSFTNKTKQGSFFTSSPPQIPYLFIPKYKNETFIMPDRVFEKGKAGKRCQIFKYLNTSIYSFKDSENPKIQKYIHKDEKSQIISGRKMQQLNRIIDTADGRVRARNINEALKTRRVFNPSRTTSDAFSLVSPMLQPKQPQFFQTKKTSLNKTFQANKWRPVSRGQTSNKTMSQLRTNKTTNLHRISSQRS